MKLTLRILRRVLIGVAGILVLAILAAHSAPVRGLVLKSVAAALRTSAAVELRAASLRYNLFTLSAELRDVELAAVQTPQEPFGTAAAVGIRFGGGVLLGRPDVRQLSLTSPRIIVRETEAGSNNLPSIRGDADGGGRALPDLDVVDLDVLLELRAATIAIRGVTATFAVPASGAMTGAIEATKGIRIVVDGKTHDLDAAAAALTLDGRILSLDNLTAKGRGISLAAHGTLTLADRETAMDLTLDGSTDVASWPIVGQDEAAPSGRVDLRARLTGPITHPKVSFDANGHTLAWQSVEVAAARAAGRYEDGFVELESFTATVASGTVHGRGTIGLAASAESGLEARWSNVDARQLLGASNEIARIDAPSGSAELRWRASDAAGAPTRFELAATTDVVAAGRITALEVRARGAGERWRVDIAPSDLAALPVRLGADVHLNQLRWQASTIEGRLEIQHQEARTLIARASDFGLPLGNVDLATVSGVLEAEASFVGRLDAMHATGRVDGRALTAAGAPPLDLTSSFAVDLRDRTSKGDLRVETTDLSLWQPKTDQPLELRGSATVTGTWSGPLTQPVVDVAVAGRNLAATRGGSPKITVSPGTFDGTLSGPINAIKGRGQLVLGDVEAGGSSLGDVTLNLTVEGRSLDVTMAAPAVKTSIKTAVALESPYAFSASGALTSIELARAMSTVLGSSFAERELGGTLSASFEATGDLEHLADATANIVVAPFDGMAYGVPLRAPSGLRATVSKERTRIDECQLTIGAIAVRGDGELGLEAPDGRLALAIDGDLGSLAPWLLRLDAERRWTTAGRINGTLGATLTPAGVVVTGSLASTLTSIAQGDHVLARNAQVLIELADSRMVIRQFTGELLGNTVQGSLDAPLTWLNGGLPERWWIRQPATDAPATASLSGAFDVATTMKEFAPDRAKGLSGRIVVEANLATPRPDLQSVTGDLRLEHAEVSTSAEATLAQTETTHLRLSGGQLFVEALDWKGSNSKFSGRGVIGLLAGARTDARLEFDSELGLISDFLRGRAAGRVTGTIAMGGSADDWKVTADASLTGARWLVPEARVLFDGWSGQLRIGEDGVALADLGGRVNGGSVRIKGRLPVTSSSSDREGGITIEVSDVLLEVPQGLHSQLGGNVVWRLAEDGATIEGTITITANRYSEPVTRVLALVESLSRTTRGSGNPLPEALANTRLAVNLVVTDPVVVDNSVASLEIMPKLRLVGSVGSPALDGRIEVERGRIQIGGRTYELRDSRLRFEPAAGLAPTLDVTGETRIGEYDVTLRMIGTPDGVETTYTSSPPLSQRDLQSLVVTGRTDTMERMPGGDDTANSAAAAGDMLGFAGKFVGLDSVRLGAAEFDLASKDVNTDQHLTISKSFGRRFELIVSDNLESGAFTWLIAWRPATGYEIRAASVENTRDSLEIRRIRFFGPGVAAREPGSADTSATTTPRIVADVVIDGEPGFPPEQLRGELHLKAGDRFVVRRWIDDRLRLQNFFRKRGYHRVRIVPSRVEGPVDATSQTISLRYEINRGPKTIIEIVGDDLPSDAVSAMYDEWHGVPVIEVLVDQFEEIAKTYLAERGFHRARVGVEFPVDTPELARAIVKVDQGPQTHRQAIAWSGNAAVSTAELDGLAEAGRSADGFDAQSLEREVRQLYGRRGYLHAAIRFGEPRFTGDLVTRPITIDEGRLTKIADVVIDGVAPARLQAATDALNLAPGTPYVPTGPSEAAKRLQAYYGNLGYRDAKIAHAVSNPKADVDVIVKVTVDEGAPYQIGAVSVSGVETTNTGVVQRAITLEPGEVASSAEADATRRNLFEIGSFRRVEVSFVPPATPARTTTNLAIQVEEPKRFQVRYGVQLASDRERNSERGPITPGATVEIRDRNFIGRAWQASVGAHYEKDFRTYTFLLSAPRFFGRQLQTSLFARERLETESTDTGSILDRRHELTLTQRKHLRAGVDLSWGYDFSDRVFHVTTPAIDNDFGGILTGPTASLAVDRRDSPFDATRGWFHSSSVQVGLPFGANLGYVRFLTRQSYYQPIGPVTVAGNLRFGMMEGYSGTPPLTILDQFFEAGGSNSVRGYSEGQLSALTFQDFNLGGPELLVMNGEVRFPLHRRLKGAAFVDAGNTFFRRSTISLGQLAVGAGIGVRVQTPLASIRFDVGYPMTTRYGSQRVRFHFSVGQMF